MDIHAVLNETQKKAVEVIDGPVLILAGPGSGKTRVITHRIAFLIRDLGINPYRIMAVTFTNKAAREMAERLKELAPIAIGKLTLGTFHAICACILRQDGRHIGIKSKFVIYDREDQLNLIKRSFQDINLDPKLYPPRAVISKISSAKSHLVTPMSYIQQAQNFFEEVVGQIYQRYQQLLDMSNAVDFDDLLMKVVLLFQGNQDVISHYQERYQYLLVDEFQDTNLTQYELVKLLSGKYRNLFVVGDPDQSIYSWRYADLRNILSFEKDYPDGKVILLEQNYRSTQRILEAASHIISANEHRTMRGLWTDNELGEPIDIVETYTEREEAQFVVSETENLLGQGRYKLSDIAVMYRTNAQSRILEEAFIRHGTPYRLIAGTRFYERREVKDIIAYLRLIYNPGDQVSLHRIINVPGRGIGHRSFKELVSWAHTHSITEYQALRVIASSDNLPFKPRTTRALLSFHHLIEELIQKSQELNLLELIDLLIERVGYHSYLLSKVNGEERWENILELRTVAEGYQYMAPLVGLRLFLEEVALISDVDSYVETIDAVTLITLHQAKGLEFPIVFIVGLEDGILPHIKSFGDMEQIEEERRLCYVGVTRAMQKVYLVRAFRRNLMGGSTMNRPSRFLKDIPNHLIAANELWHDNNDDVVTATSWNLMRDPSSEVPQLTVGDHVSHDRFGDGIVVGIQALNGDAEAVVAFTGFGIKKLLVSYAKLKKVNH